MATLQASKSPGARIEAGAAIIEAATTVDVSSVKAKIAAFEKAQKAYVAADQAVRHAVLEVHDGQVAVGGSDADQDQLVDKLAAALAGDGLPRANPFKVLGFAAPSAIKVMDVKSEARTIHALVLKVKKHKGLSKSSLDAATALDKAATAVESDVEALLPLEQAQSAAITRRDALALPWEKTFSALKRATRVAEDDGAEGLFEALFQRTVRPVAKSAKAIAEEVNKRAASAVAKAEKAAAKAAASAAKVVARKAAKSGGGAANA